MKNASKALVSTVAMLFISSAPVIAIEGLQISVQCSNVVLSWPSVPGETFIVQYRPTLDPSTPWQMLTNFYPSDGITNVTCFVHSNIVQNPNCGGSLAPMLANDTAAASEDTVGASPDEPLAMPADGSGSAVPLILYPPGFDYSQLLILDPSSGNWVSGVGYSNPSLGAELAQPKGLQPLDGGAGDDGPGDDPPGMGFYEVVRNGVHFWGLTNGSVLSGLVDIPIEIGLATTNQITGLSFCTADGSPLVGANQKNEAAPWVMEWDTRMIPNGTYAICASVDFAADDSETNSPITVAVSNEVFFPIYLTRNFGDWMWVYAQSIVFPAFVDIDMYADETNYIGTFYDYTVDGYESFLWDLTDGNGYTFTNTTFRGDFFFTPDTQFFPFLKGGPSPADAGSPAIGTNFWAKETPWSGLGNFVVACSAADANSTKTYRIQQMVAGGPGGEYEGVTQALGDYGLGLYHLSPGNDQGQAFLMSNGTTKTNLLSYLTDTSYRNFYYFGHGSLSSVGGAPGTTVPAITSREFRLALANFPSSGKPANYHPYRLIFIDGCLTGSGTMCEQFGIPAQSLSTNFFNWSGVRNRACLGFKQNITYDDAQWAWRSLMLGGFFRDWQDQTKTLPIAISNAVNGTYSSGFQKMDSSWVVLGATNMSIVSP